MGVCARSYSCMRSCLHTSCRMPLLVCMPASQCKSRLATGYFLFMWCGALVYKGTLRLGALFLSGCLVWCCSLVLGWPASEGELKSCTAAPPSSSRPPIRTRVGQMPGALGHTKSPHTQTRSSFTPIYYHLVPLLLLLISAFYAAVFCERCVCVSPSDSGDAFKDQFGFKVQRPLQSFLSTPTRRPFHSSLPVLWGLILVWAFPAFALT